MFPTRLSLAVATRQGRTSHWPGVNRCRSHFLERRERDAKFDILRSQRRPGRVSRTIRPARPDRPHRKPAPIFLESATIQFGKELSWQKLDNSPRSRQTIRSAGFSRWWQNSILISCCLTNSKQSLQITAGLSDNPAATWRWLCRKQPRTKPFSKSCDRQNRTTWETVELFDVFRGQNIPAGQKSVAYAFTYRNPQRTLTDIEVNVAQEKLLGDLKANLRASIRD